MSCTGDCSVSVATTATVHASNASDNPYRCTQFCGGGCCYIFDPSNRLTIWGHALPIIGWAILALAVLIAVASVLGIGHRKYFLSYIKSETKEAHNINEDFDEYRKSPTYSKKCPESLVIAEASNKGSVDILDLKRRGKVKIRRVCIALVGLAAANATAMILYFNSDTDVRVSGLQLSDSVKVLCYYVWATCFISICFLIWYAIFPVRTETDITSGVAGCVAALLITCYMPVIGGYDTVSGIAFTDVSTDNQGYFTNKVRYTNIVAASNTLFGFAVSFLLIANTNILIGILNGIR
jgi:hypothetical protein